ncbi:putative cytochrome p450 protein [Neofusicoccum parvum UCRNP2]|uniref:Putative cytochrome p450 protein n=1 Tax=Botryosphaeria parva (strain UCR-NP2) TaxID=1287680 RepID=R1EGA4_BOTPV|nr:putative cytochrome p450 protein [Neofusicoccum parvum UCRNP2]
MEATTPHVLALAASIIASYCVTVIIYRKFFHPLAKFPGFPEHDFEHWHKKYNSKVIRIAPHELHIADAESYKKIYNQHSPPNFRADYLRIFDIAVEAQPRIYNNPLKRHIWPKIPFWITGLFDETIRDTIGLIKYSVMCLDIHKNRTSAPRFPVLFDKLQDLPDQVQISEAMSTLIAGSDTTAFTLSFASYAISKAPAIRARLEKELKDNIADPDQMPSLGELERLPYLAACVKESLRLAMPAPGRLPRVLPASGPPLVIDGQVIPPGSVIGYSAYSVHYDESVWGTDARQFMPERWMGDDAKHLENYLVTFSKGNRACIGINLAQAEIYTVLAHLFRKFDMELLTDKLTTRDVFVQALPEEGVQVIFKPKST